MLYQKLILQSFLGGEDYETRTEFARQIYSYFTIIPRDFGLAESKIWFVAVLGELSCIITSLGMS